MCYSLICDGTKLCIILTHPQAVCKIIFLSLLPVNDGVLLRVVGVLESGGLTFVDMALTVEATVDVVVDSAGDDRHFGSASRPRRERCLTGVVSMPLLKFKQHSLLRNPSIIKDGTACCSLTIHLVTICLAF